MKIYFPGFLRYCSCYVNFGQSKPKNALLDGGLVVLSEELEEAPMAILRTLLGLGKRTKLPEVVDVERMLTCLSMKPAACDADQHRAGEKRQRDHRNRKLIGKP